jgi:hypothetical protein
MAQDDTRHSAADDAPPDPLGTGEPHDVLAAEEFAMPTRDAAPAPSDPTGIEQPHDVLAAEEFAMPVGGAGPPAGPTGAGRWIPLAAALTLGAIVIALVRRH